MNTWDIASLELRPRSPEILSSTQDARGHPGTMSLDEKAEVRQRAAERAGG